MRNAGRIASEILQRVAKEIRPGVTTKEVDEAAAQFMAEEDCVSAFLGYRGFPGQICISLNEEVVHGIGGPRRVQYGDIVKIDVGIIKDGWVGDNALTVPVGEIDPEVRRLLQVTEEALHVGIDHARAGTPLGDLSHSIERHIVETNHGRPGTKPILQAGMILAIEPMVNLGTEKVRILEDNWTVVTLDGKPSAHFEHTVLVTSDEPEILTPRPFRGLLAHS
jgi:methionyl aminopeptidase